MSVFIFVAIKHVPVNFFFFFESALNTLFGHPDNTDTLACPLGVRINRLPKRIVELRFKAFA